MNEEANDKISYKIIRQPYRITMARWNYTVVQKRILTKIISKLQREISLLEKGLSIGQLDLFSANNDSVELTFLLNDLVKNSNNYALVKQSLQQLRSINIEIILPAVKSHKSKQPEEELILTGLIERAVIRKNERMVKITMHRATAIELIKITNGLTYFAEDVMYLTDNTYTQKIYELLSHWKDKEVYSISEADFRRKMNLENKYTSMKSLIQWVIKPAGKELSEIGDIFFVFHPSRKGNTITQFNFVIKHRKTVAAEQLHLTKLKEALINMLRIHFHFKQEHLSEIQPILTNLQLMPALNNKLVELGLKISENGLSAENKITSLPRWTIACLRNEFNPAN
jgi:replication initiator protein